MQIKTMPKPARQATLTESLVIIAILIVSIFSSVFLFKDNSTGGPLQLALTFTAFIGISAGLRNGLAWKSIEDEIARTVGLAANPVFILFCVGALVGTWILCGTVPAMIYYGLKILSPDSFYPSVALICAFVSLSIGSSWTTIATAGIALLGISELLGLSTAITIGAIISGAYFGDKMSPLSDTTNLAPAAAGSELFSHIRHMAWVSIPGFILALALYTVLGFVLVTDVPQTVALDTLTSALGHQFNNIGIHLLIPLVILLVMAYKRVPALPTIFTGALVGAVFALLFQRQTIINFANLPDAGTGVVLIKGIMQVMFDGYTANTGIQSIDKLLSKGGMWSMAGTVWLILSAMLMAGVLSAVGVLSRLVQSLSRLVKSTASLITTTLANAFIMNVLTGEQYIAIVLPGQVWREEYKRRKLAAVNLSRCLEDAGTLTSPLIPWTTCGAYIHGVLSLSSFAYVPFCFFNIINPIISAIYGYTGFSVLAEEDNMEKITPTS